MGQRAPRRRTRDLGRRPAGGRRARGPGGGPRARGDAPPQARRARVRTRRGARDRAPARPGARPVRLPDAAVTFTTRQGGVSEGPYESLNLGILTDDDPARVRENRHIAAGIAGLPPERITMGWQVHGAEIRDWTGDTPDPGYADPGGRDLEKLDGHLTRDAGVGLLVMVADCFPVALSDGDQVAMLHCGWRPLAGGILDAALAHFERPPAAAVGPGIGGCCYEVGEEV